MSSQTVFRDEVEREKRGREQREAGRQLALWRGGTRGGVLALHRSKVDTVESLRA